MFHMTKTFSNVNKNSIILQLSTTYCCCRSFYLVRAADKKKVEKMLNLLKRTLPDVMWISSKINPVKNVTKPERECREPTKILASSHFQAMAQSRVHSENIEIQTTS